MRVVLVSKALEQKPLVDPRIPLLGIYFKEIIGDVHKALAPSSNFVTAKILGKKMTQIRGLYK